VQVFTKSHADFKLDEKLQSLKDAMQLKTPKIFNSWSQINSVWKRLFDGNDIAFLSFEMVNALNVIAKLNSINEESSLMASKLLITAIASSEIQNGPNSVLLLSYKSAFYALSSTLKQKDQLIEEVLELLALPRKNRQMSQCH
jgi:hypothetical protein